jgi:hypothetical protein
MNHKYFIKSYQGITQIPLKEFLTYPIDGRYSSINLGHVIHHIYHQEANELVR